MNALGILAVANSKEAELFYIWRQATPEGKAELRDLESRYAQASGRPRLGKRSIITYILVYEREHGVIDG